MEESKRNRRLFPLMESIVLIVACWVAAIFGPLSFLIPILLVFGIVRMVLARAWSMLPLLVFLSPLAFAFYLGVYSYLKGRPYLVGMGLPGTEYANIDRNTRCFRATGGCVIHGNEWVFQLPHNIAVKTMAMTLGPPKDSYDGPYPTREEAIKAAKSGTPIKPESFASGRFELGEKTIQLDPDIAEEILISCFSSYWYSGVIDPDDGESQGRFTATLWQQRCLILHWKGKQWMDEEEDGEVILLIDIESSRPFAIYELVPGSVHGRAVIGRFWR